MNNDNADDKRVDGILIEIVDDSIHCWSQYKWGNPEKFRRAGGSWKRDIKVWQFPLSMEACRALRREFLDKLHVGPKLNAWAKEAVKQEDRLKALGAQESAVLHDVPTLSPALDQAMSTRSYQQVGARFIAETNNCLIADEPGLGKTLEAIAGLMEAKMWYGPILVAAPLTSLRTVWARELAKYAPDAHVRVAVPHRGSTGSPARQRIIDEWLLMLNADVHHEFPHILIVNPEMLRDVKIGEREEPDGSVVPIYAQRFPALMQMEWNAIILDESHRYLSGVRSRQDLSLMGKALVGMNVADVGVKIALSGTPMRGKPKNLWGTLHWLRPKQYTSFWRWAQAYLEITSNGYGSTVGGIRLGAEQDLYRSLDGIMLRRTKAEVVKELPPKQFVDVYCDMAEIQRKQYASMAKSAYAELGDEQITALGVLAIMTRLKQMATSTWAPKPDGKPQAYMHPKTSGKTAQIEQMLIERGIAGPKDEREGEDKIVIASQYTEVLDSLSDYLTSIDVGHMMITGKVSEAMRVKVTDAFQSAGGDRVLLMNTKAGGVSITLDAYCDELIEIDETWVPDDQEQLEDRIHRVSRIHQVTIYKLLCADTIDERIREIVTDKDNIQKALLDGRRGVAIAKLLVEPD